MTTTKAETPQDALLPSRPIDLGITYAPQVVIPVRIDPEQKSLLDQALAALPADKSGALAFVATTKGVEAVIAARLGSGWEIAGRVGMPWGGKLEGGVQVTKSW